MDSIYVCVCTEICVCRDMYICPDMCGWYMCVDGVCICTYGHMYVWKHKCVRMCAQICVCVRTYMCMVICVHGYVWTIYRCGEYICVYGYVSLW